MRSSCALLAVCSAGCEFSRLVDESFEEMTILGVFFRMPLHPDEVPVPRVFERLHETVIGTCRDGESLTDPVNALVVIAVHAERSTAECCGKSRAGGDLHIVLGEDAPTDAVALGAERFRQV